MNLLIKFLFINLQRVIHVVSFVDDWKLIRLVSLTLVRGETYVMNATIQNFNICTFDIYLNFTVSPCILIHYVLFTPTHAHSHTTM